MHLFDFLRRAFGTIPASPAPKPATEPPEKKKKPKPAETPSSPAASPAKKTKPSPIAPAPAQQFDSRSERHLASLHPEAQKLARVFLAAAQNLSEPRGLTVKIISGLRTYAEQDALYAQGRTSPGQVITKAKGGFSNHNFGLAWDIGIFSGKKYHGEHPFYRDLGQLGESLGLEWGGRWKFRDEPHYQLRPSWAANMTEREMLAALRSRVAAKKDLFA